MQERRQHFSTNPFALVLLASNCVCIQRQAESPHPTAPISEPAAGIPSPFTRPVSSRHHGSAQVASAARGLLSPYYRRLRALAFVLKHYGFEQRVDDESPSALRYRTPQPLPPTAPTGSGQPSRRGPPAPPAGTAAHRPEPAARAPRGAPTAKGEAAGSPRDGTTYREDSPLKLPPSSSRTLQKRMPLTNGTEESSSSSSSTRNLNFFFFIIMKAMGREPPEGRPHARSEPHGSSAPPPRSAPIPGATAAPRGGSAAPRRSGLRVLFGPRPRPAALTWQPAPPRQPRPPESAPPLRGRRAGNGRGAALSTPPPRAQRLRVGRRFTGSRRSAARHGAG